MRVNRVAFKMLVCVGVLGIALAGCDSATEEEGAPPGVLPPDAFSLQTDLFQAQGGAADAAALQASPAAATKAHFTAAALRVWPVSVILSVHLLVPVTVTAAALQATPVFDDGAWVWATTTPVDGKTVQFTLTGRPLGLSVDWSMRITTSDPMLGQVYDDFELYTAQTTVDGREGDWQLYYRIGGERRNVLNAEFRIAADETKELTYRIPETAEQHGGDSALYATQDTDRRFLWQQVAEGLDHDVTWDAATQAGSITATNYNDGEPGCWDANRDDVPCPN